MTEKCVECGLDYPKPMHKTEKGLLCDICFKSEQVWDRFRKNEISHDQVQKELDEILGPDFEDCGLIGEIEDFISGWVARGFSGMMKQKLDEARYFKLHHERWEKTFEEMGWLAEFLKEDLTPLTDQIKANIGEFFDGRHNSEEFWVGWLKYLHLILLYFLSYKSKDSNYFLIRGYYTFLRSECQKRSIELSFPLNATPEERYEAWQQNAESRKVELNRPVCPECGSTHVVSSKPNWRCAECGKQWRMDKFRRRKNDG